MAPPKYLLITAILAGIFLLTDLTAPATAAGLNLTPREQAYIAAGKTIKAASIDGGAPLHYIDAEGEISGIAVRILDEVAAMTGLRFEYTLYDSIREALESDSDIAFGVSDQYAPPGMVLSQPYLKTEAILYINAARDPMRLDDKIYAGIKGGTLPEGVKGENTIYCANREECLNAVEAGRADYGYGNAFSVVFYTLQNNYKNIVTIPTGKETREYCIGFLKDDPVLLSIINKGIAAIDEGRMQTLVLDMASRIDRKITFSMIMEAHGKTILGIAFLVSGILFLAVIVNIRANNRLKLQNDRFELLSHISNECLFEYRTRSGRLELSEKCVGLFGARDESGEATARLIKALLKAAPREDNLVKLPLARGEIGTFKVVASDISDSRGNPYSVIGKLIDVTAAEAEKEELITLSRTDGLTGIYNAATVKKLITERLNTEDRRGIDAFLLIDCDNLKEINDTFGHLTGNKVLQNISQGLKSVFRETDIIGRIGGDEFCVYMKDIPTVDSARSKGRQLNTILKKTALPISVSIGIAVPNHTQTYEDVFANADRAMYQSKKSGGGEVVIHGKK